MGKKFVNIRHITCLAFIAVMALTSCRRGSSFSVSSTSGSLKIDGQAVKPLPDIGRSFDYVFTDSDPETVASDVTITAGSDLLRLPEKMSRKIAAPSLMRPIAHTISSGSGDVVIRGGDGAGAMTVTLTFSSGTLARAEADTVASDAPKVVWP